MYLLAPPGWQKRITLGTGPVGDGACQRRGLSKMGPARPTGPVLERPCPWQAPFPTLSSIVTPEGLASNRRLSKKVNLICFGFFQLFLELTWKNLFFRPWNNPSWSWNLIWELSRPWPEKSWKKKSGLNPTRPEIEKIPKALNWKNPKIGSSPRVNPGFGSNSPHYTICNAKINMCLI